MSSINILEAYVKMLLNGDAFSNCKYKPDSYKRKEIVKYILEFENASGIDMDENMIESILMESENEKEIKRMFETMKFKEEDFTI